MTARRASLVLATLALAACSRSNTSQPTSSQTGPAADQQAKPAGAQTFAASGPLSLQAINSATLTSPPVPVPAAAQDNATGDGNQTSSTNTTGAAQPGSADDIAPAMIRAEVLLDRANVSPGVIDGKPGENVSHALAAYDQEHGLPVSQTLTPQTFQALTAADGAPVVKAYTLTSQDVAGPWSPDVGENFVEMSKQQSMGYHSPVEMLAERFHMSQDLLKALNPGADFSKAGTPIMVAAANDLPPLPPVDHIIVDKAKEQVTAYGADDKIVAVFPATVGSTERPSPKGTWTVKGVAQNPDYVYNPAKLTWGPKHAGKLHIPPGPNGPVGVVWIALTAPDYGIHGTPDPRLIGKTASHGCVRLTNWDAERLSKAVKPGVKVTFEHS